MAEREEAKQPAAGLATVLRSSGPVVTCVLLDVDGDATSQHDSKAAAAAAKEDQELKPSSADDSPAVPVVLSHLIREIQVDTTPSKNGVASVLGGPITFLGQFPDQGCVVMGRRAPAPTHFRNCTLAQLRHQCKEAQLDMKGMVEKQDLIDALEQQQQQQQVMNPHLPLPPPLHKVKNVRGPILLLRVAETEEEEEIVMDEEDDAALERAVAEFQKASSVSNEEFFLDYSKEEYVQFASRTDHVIPPSSEEEDGDEEEGASDASEGDDNDDDSDDDDDDDFDPSEATEDEKKLLMNFIFSECLQQFREHNGRGPDNEEVLELRKSVAEKLGMELPDPLPAGETKKRSADSPSGKPKKRVKFDGSVMEKEDSEAKEDEDDEDDEKPPAQADDDGDSKAKQPEDEDGQKNPAADTT